MISAARFLSSARLPTLLFATLLLPAIAHARPFYGTGSGGDIPDSEAAGISSTINVSDTANITSFDNIVITGLNHAWIGDLVATLSHNGVTVDIFGRVGSVVAGGVGNSGNFTATAAQTYTFVASGGATLPSVGDATPSTYNLFPNGTAGQSSTATGTFSSFVGQSAAGAWTLKIADLAGGDLGSLLKTSWTIPTTTVCSNSPPDNRFVWITSPDRFAPQTKRLTAKTPATTGAFVLKNTCHHRSMTKTPNRNGFFGSTGFARRFVGASGSTGRPPARSESRRSGGATEST